VSLIHELSAYARYAWSLRAFLREPATPARGREIIRETLNNRDSAFLRLVRRAVYGNPSSPYLALLRYAGCDYVDLERAVHTDGLEPALRRLHAEGVYLTQEEFKGRRPVVRGGRALPFDAAGLNDPLVTGGVRVSSSGSRGPRTSTMLRLDRVAFVSQCHAVVFLAHGLVDRPTLLWMPGMPSGAGLTHLLQLTKMGVPPLRWFSPAGAGAVRPSLSKRLAALYIVHAGRLFGANMPSPEYVSGEQVQVVLAALRQVLALGRGCVVSCSPSAAARLCQASQAPGIDLRQVTFVVGGEALTPAKAEEILRVGAGVVNVYASSEVGIIGFGCAGGKAACDDVHLQQGTLAVITHRRDTPFGGGPVDAFLFTSVMDRPARILLNVESGDYGILETRECGCELGSLGLTQHLHSIRSFDKLTGWGMTFVGTNLVYIVERELPARFGGASTDYQMVETEEAGGRTRLDILVSPDVGPVDEDEVVNLVLAELSKGGDTNRMMAEVWRQGGVLRVKRERPRLTEGGKQLPLQMAHDAKR